MKQIKDYPNYSVSKEGEITNILTNKKLSQYNMKGYMRVNLCNEYGHKRFLVHRIVAENYIDNKENCKEVNHINGIKSDNRIENLEWCTRSHNLKHAYDNNLRDNVAKVAVVQLDKSKNYIAEYKSIAEASKKSSIKPQNISHCINKKQKTAGKFIWLRKEEYYV